MTEVPVSETFERDPRPGDLLEYWEERTVPTGTWHIDLEEELDELGHALREGLAKRGFLVGYNAFLSRAEATAFTYTLTVALRVHEVPTGPIVEDEVVLEAGVPVAAVFWAVVVTVNVALIGWTFNSGARIAETAPEALEGFATGLQLVAIAAALLALAYIAGKTP